MSRQNYVAAEWVGARSGDTYEKANPWRPSTTVGAFASSG